MPERITITLSPMQRRRLQRAVKGTGDAKMRTRYQIILLYEQGYGSTSVARMLQCSASTAHRVARRFLREGETGLLDRRAGNGSSKIDEQCYVTLVQLLQRSPPEYGWRRPTWTLDLLRAALQQQCGVTVCHQSISRMLHRLGARRGRPRQTVRCPWSKARRQRRVREIERLLAHLPKNEVAFWEDEADIELNPRVGPDWMLPGTQKDLLTPGVNRKHYVAGALDSRTGTIHFVEAPHKRSALFIALVLHLVQLHAKARKIHLVLDNFSIHTSKLVQQTLQVLQGRVVLHFLPPYDPKDNRIERLWRDMHENVTYNHQCSTMEELIDNVRDYLVAASPFPGSQPSLRRVA